MASEHLRIDVSCTRYAVYGVRVWQVERFDVICIRIVFCCFNILTRLLFIAKSNRINSAAVAHSRCMSDDIPAAIRSTDWRATSAIQSAEPQRKMR